jgi:hypothetical protein
MKPYDFAQAIRRCLRLRHLVVTVSVDLLSPAERYRGRMKKRRSVASMQIGRVDVRARADRYLALFFTGAGALAGGLDGRCATRGFWHARSRPVWDLVERALREGRRRRA